MSLPFRAFDADNHYYEAVDAFIRHVDPRHAQALYAVGSDRRRASVSWWVVA